MNLFPGEMVLELDVDMNEIIQKSITLINFPRINEYVLREIDLQDLIDNSRIYRPLLDSVDIICVVTNSSASNLGRTKRLYSLLEQKVKNVDFYVIANFQDLKNTAYEPEKVEKFFGIKTFVLSAIHEKAKDEIDSIIRDILTFSILEKTFNNKI